MKETNDIVVASFHSGDWTRPFHIIPCLINEDGNLVVVDPRETKAGQRVIACLAEACRSQGLPLSLGR